MRREELVDLNAFQTVAAGYHLYYPSRRQNSPAFALPVEALRCRE
nr:hypothetical protein [Sphingomonas cavernae]